MSGFKNTNEVEKSNEVPKQNEEDKIIDSFLSQVDDQRKDWVNNIFEEDKKLGKDSKNLKKGFEDFLKYANKNPLKIIQAKKKLSNCETQEDVQKFIEDHQGYKIGDGITKEVKETDEEKKQTVAEINQKSAEINQKSAEINQKSAEINQKSEDVSEIINQMEGVSNIVKFQEKVSEAIQNRDELVKSHLKSHPNLDKDTREKAEEFKNKLSEETKNQLVEKYGDKTVNDYILLRVTLNEVKNDSSFDASAVKTFESKVNELSSMDIFLKNIDNECKIADTRLSSFSSENIGQTRTELFTKGIGNESLRNARKNNLSLPSHEKAYEKMFPEEMGENAIFVKYGQFLEGDLKKYWEQYKDNYKGFMDNLYNIREQESQRKELTPEEKNILKIPGMLKGIKEKFDESAKNMIEEMCLITQINAMAKCIGQESFGLNKANDIKYDETGAMVLDGHIDGVNFSVRHNFDEDWSHLQTSSKLVKAENTNADNPENRSQIEIGKEGRFEDSPFRLPGKESIFGMISNIVASTNFSGERFNSVDDYIDNMQKGIVGKMDDVFNEDAKAANEYMKGQVKKEKTRQEIDKFVRIFAEGSSFTGIVDNSNKKLYDFLNLMDFNLRNIKYPENAAEMDKFVEVMGKINKMAELGKDNSNASELSDHAGSFGKYLTGDSLLNTRKILKNEKIDDNAISAFDLFKNYKKDYSKNTENLYKIDFEQIDRTLNVVETTRATATEAKNSSLEAENVLNLKNPNLWPPVPESHSIA